MNLLKKLAELKRHYEQKPPAPIDGIRQWIAWTIIGAVLASFLYGVLCT